MTTQSNPPWGGEEFDETLEALFAASYRPNLAAKLARDRLRECFAANKAVFSDRTTQGMFICTLLSRMAVVSRKVEFGARRTVRAETAQFLLNLAIDPDERVTRAGQLLQVARLAKKHDWQEIDWREYAITAAELDEDGPVGREADQLLSSRWRPQIAMHPVLNEPYV